MMFQQLESAPERRDLFVEMVDATDRVTPKTGLTLTVQVAKANGSAYVASAGTVVEIGSGTYRVRLASSDLDVLGGGMLKISAAGAVVEYVAFQVVRFMNEVHVAKAVLANVRTHVVATGVDQIMDDDGSTVILTVEPSETDGTIRVSTH